jgi:radical SAM protein with 4Fe4S-binding SPASM domain
MADRAYPSYIQYFPTLRCNRSCDFCFMRTVPGCGDARLEDSLRLISLMDEIGIRNMDILGGEPTVHPRLLDMMDALSSMGLSASLSTNGTNPRMLRELARRYPRERIRIGISINGTPPSEGLHQFIVEHRPMLKTVYKGKTGVLRQYSGIQGVEHYLIYMDAVCREDLDSTLPFHVFQRDLEDLKKTYPDLSGVFCGFIPQSGDPVLEKVRCPAGTSKLSVMPDGSVYPCYLFFGYREFSLGNILRDDFSIILENPVLDYFREPAENNCPHRGCALFTSCHGGCPAVSLRVLDDLYQADPRCTLK